MNRGLAVLAAAALFTSGLAIGALGVHLFYSHRITAVGGGAHPMPVGPVFERWVLHRLDLDDDQRREARAILEASRAEAEELRREVGPRLRSINRETVEALGEILNADQRRRMEEFLERGERRRRRFGGGPPRPNGPGRPGRQGGPPPSPDPPPRP